MQLPRLLAGKKGSFAKERWRRYLVALDGGREGWSAERNILACLCSFLSDVDGDDDGVDDIYYDEVSVCLSVCHEKGSRPQQVSDR